MSARVLDLLLRQYPDQVALGVRQAAVVLGLNPHTVRAWMREGRLQGARKVGEKWLVPLPVLAEVLEPTPKTPSISPPPRRMGGAGPVRRHAIVMN